MKRIFLSLLALVSIIPSANANLLLTPYYAIIEGRNRSAQVVVVNTGQETSTYMLSWRQLEQAEGLGGYVDAPDTEEKLNLQDFAVFTPRQVTLRPGEKQTIRVGVRRPADLPDGEYKSHLKFSTLPQTTPDARKLKENEVSFKAEIRYSHSIPIIYRVGDYDIQVDIGEPEFEVIEGSGKMRILVPISRSGTHGVLGMIKIFYKEDGSADEREIASLVGADLFAEVTGYKAKVPTNEYGLKPGTLRVQFLSAEKPQGQEVLMAERTFPIRN